MEEKINKEIMQYQETVAGGLTLRQFLWSGIAMAATIYCYVHYASTLGSEFASWICIFVAIPPICMGFLTWHSMPANRALSIMIHFICTPKELYWKSSNAYAVLIKNDSPVKMKMKGSDKNAVKDTNSNSVPET